MQDDSFHKKARFIKNQLKNEAEQTEAKDFIETGINQL